MLGDFDGVTEASADPTPLDEAALWLARLRTDAGGVSYGEIASRVAARRVAAGATALAAQVPRSSVYALFQTGRRRVNLDLFVDVAAVLDAPDDELRSMRARVLEVQLRQRTPRPTGAALRPTVSVEPHERPTQRRGLIPRWGGDRQVGLLLVAASIGVNFVGGAVAAKFQLPLYLDMIGTAATAIALGPWWGAFVGAASNAVLAIGSHPVSLVFAVVNIAGGLLWGFGARRSRVRRSGWAFALLNVVVAVSCSAIAVPIHVLAFGGAAPGHASAGLVGALKALGESAWAAMTPLNLAMSLVDKQLAGWGGLLGVRLLARASRPRQESNLRPRD